MTFGNGEQDPTARPLSSVRPDYPLAPSMPVPPVSYGADIVPDIGVSWGNALTRKNAVEQDNSALVQGLIRERKVMPLRQIIETHPINPDK